MDLIIILGAAILAKKLIGGSLRPKNWLEALRKKIDCENPDHVPQMIIGRPLKAKGVKFKPILNLVY